MTTTEFDLITAAGFSVEELTAGGVNIQELAASLEQNKLRPPAPAWADGGDSGWSTYDDAGRAESYNEKHVGEVAQISVSVIQVVRLEADETVSYGVPWLSVSADNGMADIDGTHALALAKLFKRAARVLEEVRRSI